MAAEGENRSLHQTFQQIVDQIRAARLYAGEPRSEQTERTVKLARTAFELAGASHDETLLLEAWRMLAHSLTANEQYEEALPYFEKLVKRLEETSHPFEAARGRLGYIAALFHTGRYDEAFAVAKVAEDWFIKNKDDDGFARLCSNVANLYHRLDDHQQAYAYHLKAVATFKAIGDSQALAKCLLNLGNALSSIDRFEESDQMYAECEELACNLGLMELSAQANYNRAYLYFLRGRYSDALQSYSRLREHFEKSGSERHYALCDLDEAEIYLQLGLSQDAADLGLRAQRKFKAIGLWYEQAKATAFYGMSLLQMGKFSEALDSFQTSQDIFQKEQNLYWMALLDLYRAQVDFSFNRMDEARDLSLRGHEVFEQLGIPSKRIFALETLGRIALASNDHDSAAKYTEQIEGLIRESRIPLVLFRHYVLAAETAEMRQQWDRAEEYYELAALDLEQNQERLHHDELRVTLFNGRYQAYEGLVRLSFLKLNTTQALCAAYAWCERAKSRGLIELLSHHIAAVQPRADSPLQARVTRLREELNFQYASSHPELRAISSTSNSSTIAAKEHELTRTLREMSAIDPEYASLQQVSIATLDTVQSMISPETTLIEYFITRDELLAFVITRNDAKVFRRLCVFSQLQDLCGRLAFQLEKFQLSEDYVREHAHQILETTNRYLKHLYFSLMEPLVRHIETPHVTLVPHGILHSLPFHAFFDGERHLIDRYEFSYAPSASVLKYCLEKSDIDTGQPLLVGVSDDKTPFVSHEIDGLKHMFFNARVLRDAKATCGAFKEGSASASFLHIATHATFRQDNPMFSGFKLADGWVTALDLFSMQCETNLVALSGCNSGMTKVSGGDDLIGLMRAFLYAGARSLLLSLWHVSDETTAMLMKAFYGEWKNGASKAKALRTAMLLVREKYPNPFHWAPFLLIGKT